MMRKRRNSGIRDVPGKRPLLGKSLLEHISLTVNMHTTVEELLRAESVHDQATKREPSCMETFRRVSVTRGHNQATSR